MNETRAYYTGIEGYHDLAESSHADQMFDKGLIAPFIRTGIVLDIGAGSGFNAELFSVTRDRYVATDFSYIGLRQVVEKGRGDGVVADAGLLPFRDASFDPLLCSWTLEHCEDPRAVLEEMLRVTRPGGRIIIWGPNWDNIFRKDFPQFVHRSRGYVRRVRWRIFLRMIKNEFLPFHYNPYINTDVAAFADTGRFISGDTDAVHCVLCQETVKFFAQKPVRLLSVSDFSRMSRHLYNDVLVRTARRFLRPLLPAIRHVPLARWFVLRFPLVVEKDA